MEHMESRRLNPGEALNALRAAGIGVVREHAGDGDEIRCSCPGHRDARGHLYVNAISGAAYCQKCGLKTHLFTLCGPTHSLAPEGMERRLILAAAAEYYHQRLCEEAQQYLTRERGLPPQILVRFRVGWADGGLRRHLLGSKGFSPDACVAAGVLKWAEGRDGKPWLRDFFYHRVVFPNIVGGQVVHLSGRCLRADEEPKWLHVPGQIHYPYNADALRGPACCWVEGIIDVLSVQSWGIPAVAGLGTGIPARALEMVPENGRVTVAMDGDAAGMAGAMKVVAAFGTRGRIAVLPSGRDPNDLLCEGRRDEFEACIEKAQDPLAFRITQIPTDTPRVELRSALDGVLRQMSSMDSAGIEAYVGAIRDRFGLSRDETNAYRRTIREMRAASANRSSESTEGDDVVYSAHFDGLVDLVEQEGEPAFLLVDTSGHLEVAGVAEQNGRLLAPPPKDQIPWLLPRSQEVLRYYEADTDGQIYDDLVAYHRDASELPGELYYEFVAIWDMHTYLLEAMKYSPEICLFAVPVRGKTRTGSSVIYVVYRGIHVTSLREAYILRFASDYGGTIFFDVRNLWQKAEREGSDDVILSRYERGLLVPRVVYPDRGSHRDTVYYSVFGPTIIGTNFAIDHILETRAVTIVMPESARKFEADVTPEAAQPLRERLTAFRARHLQDALPEAEKPTTGRLGDILRPLRQVVRLVRPDREAAFLTFVQSLRREWLKDRAETLEAAILRIVDGLREQVTSEGLLPVKHVTDRLNEGRSEKDKVSAAKVGLRLRSLGFGRGHRKEQGATFQWDEETLRRAMDAYGVRNPTDPTDPTASEARRPSVALSPEASVESVGLLGDAQGGAAHAGLGASGPDSLRVRSSAPSGPCYACRGTRFWLDRYGAWHCGRCHAPADEALVCEWLTVGEAA